MTTVDLSLGESSKQNTGSHLLKHVPPKWNIKRIIDAWQGNKTKSGHSPNSRSLSELDKLSIPNTPFNGATVTCRPSSPFVFRDERGPIWRGHSSAAARYEIFFFSSGMAWAECKAGLEGAGQVSRYGKIMMDAMFLDQVNGNKRRCWRFKGCNNACTVYEMSKKFECLSCLIIFRYWDIKFKRYNRDFSRNFACSRANLLSEENSHEMSEVLRIILNFESH